jgi:hypothetical protein
MRTIIGIILATIGMHTELALVQALAFISCFIVIYYDIKNDKSLQ